MRISGQKAQALPATFLQMAGLIPAEGWIPYQTTSVVPSAFLTVMSANAGMIFSS
jgi:hypothetical protein